MNNHPQHDLDALRAIAESLSKAAGTIALQGRRGHVRPETATKSSPTDMVTEFDRAAEAHIVEWLRDNRPDDAIIGEEGTNDDGSSGYEWHIDPIDGTTNFVYDLPAWACSIGVRYDDRTLVGAVYAPALDEMYSAAAGCGATRNGQPIRCSDTGDLAAALIATGFGFKAQRRVKQAQLLVNIIGDIRDIRRYGAASLDLCFVACGRIDAYYEIGLNSWDIVAGQLIATEAGATATDFGGGLATPDELLVSSPTLHAPLSTLLATH